MKKWDVHLMPDLEGKVAIVTGGNTGLGYQSSLELARRNATVIIACRSLKRGKKAIDDIKEKLGNQSRLDVIQLDLADFTSIHQFGKTFMSRYQRLDILMNNAGVVNQEMRGMTEEGHETHFGINHLGHFLLTGLLLDRLLETEGARVVTMSSGGYKQGNINFDDLNWEKRPYHRVKSYGDSKLANLLFTLKLQQYFELKGVSAMAVAAHPGLSASPRQQSIGIGGKLSKWLASPLERGSRPQLLAASAPFVQPLDYYGPKYGIDGPPKKIKIKHPQYNQEIANKLWQVSESLTRFSYK
jgi:NAD(P)-dependent dehydrogenase (short-subunit alcohol dehydrogenase family)